MHTLCCYNTDTIILQGLKHVSVIIICLQEWKILKWLFFLALVTCGYCCVWRRTKAKLITKYYSTCLARRWKSFRCHKLARQMGKISTSTFSSSRPLLGNPRRKPLNHRIVYVVEWFPFIARCIRIITKFISESHQKVIILQFCWRR